MKYFFFFFFSPNNSFFSLFLFFLTVLNEPSSFLCDKLQCYKCVCVCVLDNQRSKRLELTLRNFFFFSISDIFFSSCKLHEKKQLNVVVFVMILLYFIHLRDSISTYIQDLFLLLLLLLLLFFVSSLFSFDCRYR